MERKTGVSEDINAMRTVKGYHLNSLVRFSS